MRKQLRVLVQHCVNCSESPSRARCLKNGALILCSIYICMGGAGGFVSQAAMNLETEAPAAGASVIINHYHASRRRLPAGCPARGRMRRRQRQAAGRRFQPSPRRPHRNMIMSPFPASAIM